MSRSWLERAGLVKSDNDGNQNPNYSVEELQAMVAQSGNSTTMNFAPVAEVEVNSEGLLTVEEIYQQFNLQDLNKSIFKVDEFSKVLPDTLDTATKRQSVIGILTASGLQVDTLKEDAHQRLGALNSVTQQVTDKTVQIVEQAQTDIAELEQQIDSLKKTINDRKNLQEQQEKLLQVEEERINTIVKFVG